MWSERKPGMATFHRSFPLLMLKAATSPRWPRETYSVRPSGDTS